MNNRLENKQLSPAPPDQDVKKIEIIYASSK